jgi:predicted peptidase
MQQDDFSLAVTLTLDVSIPYRVYLPNNDDTSGDGHPLLIFLHGAGYRGDDLNVMARIGLPRYIEEGADLPFVTVCPQCPLGESWNTLQLIALLDKIIADYNINTSRVYLTGLSMGGRGTWDLANQIADRLAAAIPICGPFSRVNPDNFKQLPIWCFHGVMDSTIPVADSVRMVKMLREAGCSVDFTTYSNADHDSWTETYNNPSIYDWLLSHKKPQT